MHYLVKLHVYELYNLFGNVGAGRDRIVCLRMCDLIYHSCHQVYISRLAGSGAGGAAAFAMGCTAAALIVNIGLHCSRRRDRIAHSAA